MLGVAAVKHSVGWGGWLGGAGVLFEQKLHLQNRYLTLLDVLLHGSFNILQTSHYCVCICRNWPISGSGVFTFQFSLQARSRFLWGRSWSRLFWRPCFVVPGVLPSPHPSCPGWLGWRPASLVAASKSWSPTTLWERASLSHFALSARVLTTSSACPHM